MIWVMLWIARLEGARWVERATMDLERKTAIEYYRRQWLGQPG